jgi:multiple sugar transport system ATP-binding protein
LVKRGIQMGKVVCEHVVKKFGQVTAVDDFNLEIEDNEFIVIVGPSGCGKSTSLRMIAGLEEQTSGNIYIGGQLVNDKPPRDRNIAMVFQNYALYPHMNVYDNMAFSLKLHGVAKDEIDRKVKEAAEVLNISDYLSRKPKELSGGQRQRVALGRAIVREPAVFLMDEPLSNLDAKLRVQMRTEISKLHARLGATTIYVTHDQTEAMTMADRIVVMKDGIIQQISDPQTLYDKPVNRFVASFIGAPPMNFINCRLDRNAGGGELTANGMKVAIPTAWADTIGRCVANEVVLGVRPENIHPGQQDSSDISARVEVVEPLGSETLLHLKLGEQNLIVKVNPDYKPALGQIIKLTFEMNKAHLFSHDSGLTII